MEETYVKIGRDELKTILIAYYELRFLKDCGLEDLTGYDDISDSPFEDYPSMEEYCNDAVEKDLNRYPEITE